MDRVELENQIIYFILSDPKLLESSILEKGIDVSSFSDEGNRLVSSMAFDYFERFGKCVPKEEFDILINDKLNKKKITQAQHHSSIKAFKRALNLDGEITPVQFDRIAYDLVSVVKNTSAREIILKHSGLLNSFKTLDYIDKITGELDKLRINNGELDDIEVLDVYKDIELQIEDLKKRRNDENARGIPTGIRTLDERFVGFEKRFLTIVAAVINTGKSTFVLNVSRNAAEFFGKKVLIMSLEMPTKQWARKYNALDCWVPYSYLQRGNKTLLPDDEFENFCKRLEERRDKGRSGEYRIISAPASKYSFKELMNLKDKKLPTYKPDIIFIDQLSLIKLPGKREKKDELGDLTKEIIAYGYIKDIAMVAVAQANRASIRRNGAKREIDINIENLEDSNKIGADAHNVLALMSPPSSGGHRMLLKIVKQRDGETGTFEIASRLDYCAIIDIETEEIGNSSLEDGDLVFGEEEIDDTGLDAISGEPVKANLPENLSKAIAIDSRPNNEDSILNKSAEELKKQKNPFAADDDYDIIRTNEMEDIFNE